MSGGIPLRIKVSRNALITQDIINETYLPIQLTGKYASQVKGILYESDKEFIPPLSARHGTTEEHLDEDTGSGIPMDYLDVMLKQQFILALDHRKVIGFVSYIPDSSALGCQCVYISTGIVKPEYRNKKVTEEMLRALFWLYEDETFITRTWSTNRACISLLEKTGFELLKTVSDDRGEGIDTLYYKRI